MRDERRTDAQEGTKPSQSAFGPTDDTPVVQDASTKKTEETLFPERPQTAFGPNDPWMFL